MADKKLTELEEATSIADTDLLYVSSGGVSKKIQASKIIATEQISNITACGQNVIGLIKNGRVYTATSNATTYTADATGRGLSTSINTNDLYSSGFIQVPIPTSSPVIKLLLNHSDMFALCENGELYVWGKNTSKCLGLNHANIVPFPVLSNTNVIDIYGHASNGEYEGYMYNQMIIKKDDGKFYGVGTNYQGAFGLGNTTALSVWTELTGLGINNIADRKSVV